MSKRWSPGKGWRRIADAGDLAVWMRGTDDGVRIAVYTGDGFGHRTDGRAEVWIVETAPGSDLPYQVIDKPRRVRWVMDGSSLDRLVDALVVPRSHAGHRRLRRSYRIWRRDLPRKLRDRVEKPWAWRLLGI